jgi:hypothetical protein
MEGNNVNGEAAVTQTCPRDLVMAIGKACRRPSPPLSARADPVASDDRSKRLSCALRPAFPSGARGVALPAVSLDREASP